MLVVTWLAVGANGSGKTNFFHGMCPCSFFLFCQSVFGSGQRKSLDVNFFTKTCLVDVRSYPICSQ